MQLEKVEEISYWSLIAKVRAQVLQRASTHLFTTPGVEGRPHNLASVYNVMDDLRLDLWQTHPDFSDTSSEEIDRCRMPRFVSFLRRLTQLSKDSASCL